MKADHECRIAALAGILLTFVSGAFSLARIDLGSFKIRYALFALSLPLLLASLGRGVRVIRLSRSGRQFLGVMYAFLLYAAISLFWLDNIATGIPKFIDVSFMFATLLALSVAVHTFDDRDELAVVVAYFFIAIGVVYSCKILMTGLASESYQSEVYAGGHNVQTRILFMAVCSSLFLSAHKGGWIYAALLCVFLTGIVLLASKQGIITAPLMLILFLLLKLSERYRHRIQGRKRLSKRVVVRRLLATAVVISVTGWFLIDKMYQIIMVTNTYFHRFYVWDVFANNDLRRLIEKGDRARLFVNSVTAIRDHPWFGIGLAGYLDVPGIAFYPHNIALEFALDGGVLGVLFLLVFLVYGLYLAVRTRKSIYLPFSLIPIYMVIVSLVSSGLYDFRYYFMWVIILLYLTDSSHLRSTENVRDIRGC